MMSLTEAQRSAILQRALQHYWQSNASVEQLLPTQAVLAFGRPVNHALHFLLGVLTLSAWWAVWLLLVLTHRTERMGIAVDDDGVVQTTSLHTGRVTARFDGRPWLVQD